MDERSRDHHVTRRRDSRSRSPRRNRSEHHRRRSRSPRRHREQRRAAEPSQAANVLPYDARQLSQRDFEVFRPMFALYLDIQKGKNLDDMDDREGRGRWKSFIGKWNRGELPEGWYDPSTFQKARQSATTEQPSFTEQRQQAQGKVEGSRQKNTERSDTDSESDDSIGPALPGQEERRTRKRAGPSIPNMEDLELKREMAIEDEESRRDDIRYARKLDRKQQKEALEDLAPRAEAGTRERQLEKKREVNEKMKAFREKSPGAADVPDSELMGDGDGLDSYKREKEAYERKKSERELRKEEFLRARQAEREERMQQHRAKEDSTMAMLKALAKQNFG